MKKLSRCTWMGVGSVALMALTGCSGSQSTDEVPVTPPPPAEAAPVQPATAAPVAEGSLTEEDRKYIQMYSEVLTHTHAAKEVILRHWERPIDDILTIVTAHFDAAWSIHVKHIGTPPRFYKTNEDLRLGLKKWSEGLEALKTGSGKIEINQAIDLLAASEKEYEKVTKGLLGKK